MNTGEIKKGSNRSFGIVFSFVFLIIALFPLINDHEIRLWSLITAIIFLLLGLTNSKILTSLNTIWFKFGILLGKIVSPIIMGIIFFLVVTPIGLLMRLLGKDVINLKLDKKKNSYWVDKVGSKSKMKNQF